MLTSIKYILTIAEVERKMLYRKAKFWVLGGGGLIGIVFFMVVMTIVSIVEEGIPGEFLLEGTDAYLALYFFSYAQAIVIAFVAGDFRKSEEKARLDQVMLSRPMTTANWVMGKYFGVVSGVLYLNLFLIIIAVIGRTLKVIFTGTSFNILPFLEYFAIATLPSILFMTALVFFLVSVFRAQSVAMIISLGYWVSILVYFRHNFLGLFDYGAFFAPIFSSDFIGFGNIEGVLWQRLFFVLLAFSLIAFSILLYPRLWQSRFSKYLSIACAVLFLFAAGGVGYIIFEKQQTTLATRNADFDFHKSWISKPICKVTHYDLDIRFGNKQTPLDVSAKLFLTNPNDEALREVIFALNGQLTVSQVSKLTGDPIPFKHEQHLLILDLANSPLMPNSIDSIQISYSGKIDADGFMLDRLPKSKGRIDKSNGPWVQPNESAWLSEGFAVLPAQCGWYPVPGAAAGYNFSSPRPQNFATADIRVKTGKGLSVISQGRKTEEKIDEDTKLSRFSITKAVPGLSLNIGDYKRLTHKFRQTEIELYVHKKHLLDYDLFADVADTCYEVIESILDICEQVSGLPYPYDKLAIVEVPLHMQVFTSRFGLNNVMLQPEIIMLGEVIVAQNRFKKEIEDETKDARRDGRDDSPQRIKREVFIEMVLNTFFSDDWRRSGSLSSPLKNYLHFQVDITNPVLSRALELQLYEESERRVNDLFYPDRWDAALSSNDRMRQNEGGWRYRHRYGIEVDSLISVLTKTPLAEIFPADDGNLYSLCVDFKAPPVLQMLSKRVGEKNYTRALSGLVEKYRHQQVDIADFLKVIQSESNENIEDFFDEWFNQATFPGYRITQATAEKLDTGKLNIVYQVSVRVQNGEKGDGFVRLVCKTKNDKIWRNLRLGSYEEKLVQFPVKEEPRQIEVIPYFSRNRGQIVKQVSISNRIKRQTPVDTSFVVTSINDSLVFVLDDQDDGFFTPVGAEAKYLRPPSKGASWWEDTNRYAFGKYYFSWRIKNAGDGSYPARWVASVPKDGDYELSFYFRAGHSWYARYKSQTYYLNVTSSQGTFPIEIQPHETADGWVHLGRFNFKKNKPAVVQLEDEGSGYLIADAIRWEFVE